MLSSRIFTDTDQKKFALLSGDSNPMHMDRVYARRTQAGEPVVHGIHGAMWALETLSQSLPLENLSSLKIKFERFVRLGEPVSLHLVKQSPSSARADIMVDGSIVTVLMMSFGARTTFTQGLDVRGGLAIGPDPETLQEFGMEDVDGLQGFVSRCHPDEAFVAQFPLLSDKLGAGRVACLANLSRLVGMVCPGLHSIFVKVSVELVEAPVATHGLEFAVSRADDRFRMVSINVAGDGIFGSVDTLMRMPPTLQPACAGLQGWVDSDAFAGSTALIVGGSRGLGELTAKLIAAGGGHSIITYAVGKAEAEAVAADIALHGGRCSIMPFDFNADVTAQMQNLPGSPTHLYYFATPRIYRQKPEIFSASLLAEFMTAYVETFFTLCTQLKPRKALYPSTVFVDERPRGMTEYAMAKSAGEVLCADMNNHMQEMQVIVERLPRMLTDQTATTSAVETASALDVMRPIILKMQHQ